MLTLDVITYILFIFQSYFGSLSYLFLRTSIMAEISMLMVNFFGYFALPYLFLHTSFKFQS
jgi:hypothetical protein